jgi:hypothetical protein
MPKPRKSKIGYRKSPGRNQWKRAIMPGAWEDQDGNGHINVLHLHAHMRSMGFPIVDTPKEIADTTERIRQILIAKGYNPKTIITRHSEKD